MIFWTYQTVLVVLLLTIYPLNHITEDYLLKNVIGLIFCEIISTHPHNAVSALRHLVTNIVISTHFITLAAPILSAVYTPKANLICGAMKLHTKSMAWCEITLGTMTYPLCGGTAANWHTREAIVASIASSHKFRIFNLSNFTKRRKYFFAFGVYTALESTTVSHNLHDQ